LAALVEDAHRRGIRIISDLVMNHTSDQHPWFAESRSSRDNPKSDWYMWADDDQGFKDVRVIFVDAEPSNWTFDSPRQQYYWHRFFHHQPDLNYDNPEVVEAMLGVVRFWLDLGLDGFRFDAVPYLYKAEGTSCENLPATHKLLRRIRAEMDASYPGRLMLAEVNQWPSVVTEYFGDGDECHMCFNFPLMPRMFMAVRREQRFPITAIQWAPERNAGFPRADFAQLYLPPLMDPVHGYQAVNVEAEQRDPSSFLHWFRRMLAVRHQYPQFATGSLEVLPADNPSVLAYVRLARVREPAWQEVLDAVARAAENLVVE